MATGKNSRGMLAMIASRTLLAALAWWIVSEGQPSALPVGLLAITAVVGLSLVLAPRPRQAVRLWGLVLFLGYFLSRSLLAGLDVARRILQPALPIDPILERVPLSLQPGPPRWLLANTLSLLPGTLTVALEDDMLVLHCLNHSSDRLAEIRAVERRVARVFGLPWGAPGG